MLKVLWFICHLNHCSSIIVLALFVLIGTTNVALFFCRAPELFIVNAANITEKTDIWSLGCVFIELFGSMIPWARMDDVAIGKRVTSKDEKLIIPPEVSFHLRIVQQHRFL
jgi:serine/threonine protein kinase